MIDEKKIQKGIKACFDRRIDDKVEREFMRDPLLAYTRAFGDAIEWFKKAIWHHEDEVPETDKYLLLHLRSYEGQNAFGFRIIHTRIDVDVKDFDKKQQWETFCEICVLYPFDWCYIDDLLPRKGGQEDD